MLAQHTLWNLLQDVVFMMRCWTRFLYQPRGYISSSGISNQLLLQTQMWPLLCLHGGNRSHPIHFYFLSFLPLFLYFFLFFIFFSVGISATVLVSSEVYWPKAVLFLLGLEFQFVEIFDDTFCSLFPPYSSSDIVSLWLFSFHQVFDTSISISLFRLKKASSTVFVSEVSSICTVTHVLPL